MKLNNRLKGLQLSEVKICQKDKNKILRINETLAREKWSGSVWLPECGSAGAQPQAHVQQHRQSTSGGGDRLESESRKVHTRSIIFVSLASGSGLRTARFYNWLPCRTLASHTCTSVWTSTYLTKSILYENVSHSGYEMRSSFFSSSFSITSRTSRSSTFVPTSRVASCTIVHHLWVVVPKLCVPQLKKS